MQCINAHAKGTHTQTSHTQVLTNDRQQICWSLFHSNAANDFPCRTAVDPRLCCCCCSSLQYPAPRPRREINDLSECQCGVGGLRLVHKHKAHGTPTPPSKCGAMAQRGCDRTHAASAAGHMLNLNRDMMMLVHQYYPKVYGHPLVVWFWSAGQVKSNKLQIHDPQPHQRIKQQVQRQVLLPNSAGRSH